MKRTRFIRVGVLFVSLGLIIGGILLSVWYHGGSQDKPALAADALGATVSTKVQVPASMRTDVFATDRYLTLPQHFSIEVYTRLAAARFMAVAPNGDLLVSMPGSNKIELVRPNNAGNPLTSDFVTGLKKPQGMVFHTIGTTTYLYVAETNQIDRYIYKNGDTTAHDRQIIITGLPDSSLPELHGTYGHEPKDIVFDANDKLYVSIGSTCNACTSDTISDPIRGAIYQYDADGHNKRLFAKGLRNAEGLALLPGTNDLWAAVNNRDNIAYPYQDATGNYGKVIPSYVDNHPPEEFTRLRDGGNSGWPFCNPNLDSASGANNMPFDQDYEFNADGHVDCTKMDRINKGIQAHSAPLGLTFLQSTQFAAPYRQGALIGLHGSWNRTQRTGYKVAYFPWDTATQSPGAQTDFVTGWLDDGSQQYWGRPVDIVVDQQGNLFISDDTSGTVYKMTYHPTQTVPTQTPPSTPTSAPAAGNGHSLFSTGFENGNLQPTWSNTIDGNGQPAGGILNVSGICCQLTGPETGIRHEISHSGKTALLYSGKNTSSKGSHAYTQVFDLKGKNILVGEKTTLDYWIYPQNQALGVSGGGLAQGTNSTCVAIDLIFTDKQQAESNLRDSGAVEQKGNRAHPAFQCNKLMLNTWNHVMINLGAHSNGKTITRIDVGADQPKGSGSYRGYIDDISIHN